MTFLNDVRVALRSLLRTKGLTATVVLTQNHQEITVVSLDLKKDGTVVRGSQNNVFKGLFQSWGG